MNKIINIFPILNMMLLSLLACNPGEENKYLHYIEKGGQPYRILKTDPPFWKVGDSVIVSFEAVYDPEKWMPGSVELILPQPEPSWVDSNTLKLLWVPDNSLLEMMPPIAKVIDDFLVPSHEFGISTQVEFHAIKNKNGKYHFERQKPKSSTDTFYFERFHFD